ncbi:ParB/RepB/Spo0J family partition protein [Kitasatospora sp. NPDC085464]|uniref:ParB/RepB/Spo0J family partition protein n=1 Tax=Kitasatospora sp. NPDC085464 TaxID=3364063 RepID=UPI0037C98D2D
MPIDLPTAGKKKRTRTEPTPPVPSQGTDPEGPKAEEPPQRPTYASAIYVASASNGDIVTIPLNEIAPSPHNDRDPGDVTAEAEHMKTKGVLQAISVMRSEPYLKRWGDELRADPERAAKVAAVEAAPWVILFGERRWRAAQQAGLKDIDAFLRDDLIDDAEEIIASENLLRKNPTPIEEARQYLRFQEQKRMSYTDIALVSGRSRGHISKRLSLLKLSPTAQAALSEGHLGPKAALEIAAALPDHDRQTAVVELLGADQELTHREAINQVLQGKLPIVSLAVPHQAASPSPEAGAPVVSDSPSAPSAPVSPVASEPRRETPTNDQQAPASAAAPVEAPPAAPASASAPAKGASGEDRFAQDRKNAAADRSAACRSLLETYEGVTEEERASMMQGALLTSLNLAAAQNQAHAWLVAANVHELDVTPASAYFQAVLQSERPALVERAAFAVALAGAEIRAADRRRASYDAQDKRYVEFLRSAGYIPDTDWEKRQLGLPTSGR